MFKYLVMCSTLLFTEYVQAAEANVEKEKSFLLFSHGPDLVMFHELIKQHRDETVACFGEPKEGELYYGAQVISPSARSASMYFYVPLSIIEKKKESEIITTNTGDELTIIAALGHTLPLLIAGLKKRFADRPPIRHSFDPSTQKDIANEEFEKMSNGDPAMRALMLRLAQVEKEVGHPCVIM